jgi:hypothetical protein
VAVGGIGRLADRRGRVGLGGQSLQQRAELVRRARRQRVPPRKRLQRFP